MLRRFLLPILLIVSLASAAFATPPSPVFGVADHPHVNIEWWYVNAHVTTSRGRHLAFVAAFFRFGNGASPLDPLEAAPRAHYLIYAVTDLDRKTHQSYSLADSHMVALLHLVAPLLAASNPSDQGAQALLESLKQGHLPPGNQEIHGKAVISNSPFRIAYGKANMLTQDSGSNRFGGTYTLNLGTSPADQIHLNLVSTKPPMAVGGTGETGLKTPSDMHYYSLTRCNVSGTINTGHGPERITSGEGWFDHQWGNSWVADNDGWDWWGVQLNNGTDILFFRQRDLATGKTFYPLATFMDKRGHESVTKDIIFHARSHSLWKSPLTGVVYPLRWTIQFPKQHLTLQIAPAVKNQEMPILGPGGGIWEGTCRVSASYGGHQNKMVIPGVAYMELVGYNSPAVKARLVPRLPLSHPIPK